MSLKHESHNGEDAKLYFIIDWVESYQQVNMIFFLTKKLFRVSHIVIIDWVENYLQFGIFCNNLPLKSHILCLY